MSILSIITTGFSEARTERQDEEDHLEKLIKLLKLKFSDQQQGKKKWLVNRLDWLKKACSHETIWFEGFIPIEWMKDRELVLNLIKNQQINSLDILPGCLLEDREIALEFFKHYIDDINNIYDIPSCFLEDREFMMELLVHNHRVLRFCEFSEDEDFLLEYILRNRRGILYISDSWKHSKSFVEKLTRIDKYLAWNFVECKLNANTDEKLRNNKQFVMDALMFRGEALEFASDELKADRQVLIQALNRSPYALNYLPPSLHTEEFMKSLILDLPYLFEMASFNITNNRDFVLTLLKKHGNLIYYAPNNIRMDKEAVITAILQDPDVIEIVPHEFYLDRDVLLASATHKFHSFFYLAPESLRSNRDFMLEVIKTQGTSLKYASPDLQDDKTIVREAVRENQISFQFASFELKSDEDYVIQLIREGFTSILQYASISIDRNLAEKLVKINGHCLKYLGSFIPDPELELEAVRQNGFAMNYSDSLYNERITYAYYGAKI